MQLYSQNCYINMKKIIITILSLIIISVSTIAQSLNPLNYSGKMYPTSFEILSTPRYISYEDHAILSTEMTIPVFASMEARFVFDFEKCTISYSAKESVDKNPDNKEYKIKVTSVKKYSDKNKGWVVVIYIDNLASGNKEELVWSEFGIPYIQEITIVDDSVKIARMYLSDKPSQLSF